MEGSDDLNIWNHESLDKPVLLAQTKQWQPRRQSDKIPAVHFIFTMKSVQPPHLPFLRIVFVLLVVSCFISNRLQVTLLEKKKEKRKWHENRSKHWDIKFTRIKTNENGKKKSVYRCNFYSLFVVILKLNVRRFRDFPWTQLKHEAGSLRNFIHCRSGLSHDTVKSAIYTSTRLPVWDFQNKISGLEFWCSWNIRPVVSASKMVSCSFPKTGLGT